MNDNVIKEAINNNPSQITMEYAQKLLERVGILISKEKTDTLISKFCLLKTLAADICFSCELLLKARINDYHNGNDFSSWKSHNLFEVFDKLEDNDKEFIYRELGLTDVEFENILRNDSTSDAFIKRYLYEANTGIPNYNFLCDLANALLKLNNKNISYDLKNIDTLSNQFNTTQFSFEDIIKEHSLLIYRKSEIYDIGEIQDDIERYIVENMKSCDYALFAELRYKYFDKSQNPRKDHEFSQLHKRLDEACKFLVSKGRFMNRYMSKNSTIDFSWALESLMFCENFNAGDTVKELYNDLNETFEKSRYCTTEYFMNYYDSRDFAITIKSITDLLIMNGDKANIIIKNKNELLKQFGIGFLMTMAFTVDEVERLDMDYIRKLNDFVNLKDFSSFFQKSILLETDEKIRNKIFYFLSTMPQKEMPICIDYIVNDVDNVYSIDIDKYNADIELQKYHLQVNAERIDKYVKLSEVIKQKQIIIYIINNNINVDVAIDRYLTMINRCLILCQDENAVNNFIENVGILFIETGEIDKLNKCFLLYDYFKNRENRCLKIEELKKMYTVSFDKIINIYSLFKSFNLEKIFFRYVDRVANIQSQELKEKLKICRDNEMVLKSYFENMNLFNIDIIRLLNFLRKFQNNSFKNYIIDLEKFNSGEIEQIYEILKDKNLLFLCNTYNFVNVVKNNEVLDEILNQKLVLSIVNGNYDARDKNSIGMLIMTIFKNTKLKNVLMDLFQVKIVRDYPKVLEIFRVDHSILEKVYCINIYNNWYERIKSNNIICNGAKLSLNANQISQIISIFIEVISESFTNIGKEELSNRLEKIFSDSQLVYSINQKILVHYNIDFMGKIIKKSKFKFKDFDNYNYFGNLFETIDTNRINEDKILNILNYLYQYKNSPVVLDFVKKLCDCVRKEPLIQINLEDDEGTKNFDDDLLDYLFTKISSKNESQLIDYISHINIVIDNPLIYNENYSSFGKTYEEKKKIGKDILSVIRDKIITGTTGIKNELLNRIANSYIANKIAIYRLNRKYKQIIEEEAKEHGKRR